MDRQDRLDKFQEMLEAGLVKVCRMSDLEVEIMSSPDLDAAWNVMLEGYVADAVENFNEYPFAALGFAAYLGMAVANRWDKDWILYRDAPYTSYYGDRGFDNMDDHIVADVLHLDGAEAAKLKGVVLNCTQAVLDLLRYESIETDTEFGFYALVRCYSAMFKTGASIELKRLGYTLEIAG